ncbi:alpha-1-antiproteinase-like [Hyperolius riggenbachi]|uniref:alpha-1-antiproteinase-like n=1 Tax=Hyperolius riggenbachi TaxID=752182 RepID=UPI0035A26AEE
MRVFLFACLSQALLNTVVFGLPIKEEEPYGGNDDDHNSPQNLPVQKIVQQNNEFTYMFYGHLANKYPDDNIFCSPESIALLFSMVSAGAKGQTQTEIFDGLGFNMTLISEDNIHKGYKELLNMLNQTNSDLVLDIANAFFAEKSTTFQEDFLEDIKNFQAEAITTDFQHPEEAKNQINNYVKEKTNGMIKNLLDSLDPATLLVILNTIYFSGKWETPFNKNRTQDADFQLNNDTMVKVPMMSKEGTYNMTFIDEVGCTLVEVPYQQHFSAIFIIPHPGQLQEVEKAVQNNSLEKWMEEMHPRRIIFSLPKFTMSSSLDLTKELPSFGIKTVFSDNADLSGITGSKNLRMSKAVHKAAVSVDEAGTEAAAASAGGVVILSLPQHIIADKPFMFVIKGKITNAISFIGRVAIP